MEPEVRGHRTDERGRTADEEGDNGLRLWAGEIKLIQCGQIRD